MEVFLFLLGALVGFLISRHYYQRAKDDTDSAEAKREAKENWRRSSNYFEHMLTASTWEQTYLNDLVTWTCPKDVTLKIVVPDSTDDFIEPWTERYADKRGRRTDVQLRVNDSTIAELPFIHLDGGRILVPMPRRVVVDGAHTFFWERDSIEFKVGKVIGHYYIHDSIEGIAKISDISILRGPADA